VNPIGFPFTFQDHLKIKGLKNPRRNSYIFVIGAVHSVFHKLELVIRDIGMLLVNCGIFAIL